MAMHYLQKIKSLTAIFRMLLKCCGVACITDAGIDFYVSLVIVGRLYHKNYDYR